LRLRSPDFQSKRKRAFFLSKVKGLPKKGQFGRVLRTWPKGLKLITENMKTDIHPKYYPAAKATCACGAQVTVGSTMEAIEMEICSQCHPLFTGNEKVTDTAGRIEKFKARTAAAKPKKAK